MSGVVEALITEAAAAFGTGHTKVAVIGLGPEALQVRAALSALGGEVEIYDPRESVAADQRLAPWSQLGAAKPQLVVIARDTEKEELLRAAADVLDANDPLPQVILSGVGQQERSDPIFEDLEAPAMVPSYATGNPHTRAHLYDCLRAAAANGREGAVVELGAFKGGTSVWLARAAAALGLKDSRVIAFDAWEGFPPRRSILDLYEHPRCVFRDLEAVRAYTEPHGIELVVGDIAETAPKRLVSESILLAFIDTDNYSATRAALEPIRDNLVPGGAIVFDHYFTTSDYAYTIGERMAGVEALGDSGLLQLRGTGVFVNVS
ncbi:MAG TPA: class I SAM-dependent methyltransferase [Solirubrobacterales bacterium]|nr:class I SAM-dependent methyltransferase [Solirubrobacterales bacterium]